MSTKLPEWSVKLFIFVSSFFLCYLIVMPARTPDYERGHKDGYNLGYTDGLEVVTLTAANSYLAGLRDGKLASKKD